MPIKFNSIKDKLLLSLFLCIIILTWYFISISINLNKYLLPDLIILLKTIKTQIFTRELYNNLLITLYRAFFGITLGCISGIICGLIISKSRIISKLIIPFIDFIRSIPTSMLFPLIMMFIGFEEKGKIFIVFISVFPIFLISTFLGVQSTPDNMGRRIYLNINKKRISPLNYWLCIIWDSLPTLLSGLKISLSIGLILVIVTEMFFTSNSGIGWAAYHAYLSFEIEELYMYIFIVGLCGLSFNSSVDYLILRTK